MARSCFQPQLLQLAREKASRYVKIWDAFVKGINFVSYSCQNSLKRMMRNAGMDVGRGRHLVTTVYGSENWNSYHDDQCEGTSES